MEPTAVEVKAAATAAGRQLAIKRAWITRRLRAGLSVSAQDFQDGGWTVPPGYQPGVNGQPDPGAWAGGVPKVRKSKAKPKTPTVSTTAGGPPSAPAPQAGPSMGGSSYISYNAFNTGRAANARTMLAGMNAGPARSGIQEADDYLSQGGAALGKDPNVPYVPGSGVGFYSAVLSDPSVAAWSRGLSRMRADEGSGPLAGVTLPPIPYLGQPSDSLYAARAHRNAWLIQHPGDDLGARTAAYEAAWQAADAQNPELRDRLEAWDKKLIGMTSGTMPGAPMFDAILATDGPMVAHAWALAAIKDADEKGVYTVGASSPNVKAVRDWQSQINTDRQKAGFSPVRTLTWWQPQQPPPAAPSAPPPPPAPPPTPGYPVHPMVDMSIMHNGGDSTGIPDVDEYLSYGGGNLGPPAKWDPQATLARDKAWKALAGTKFSANVSPFPPSPTGGPTGTLRTTDPALAGYAAATAHLRASPGDDLGALHASWEAATVVAAAQYEALASQIGMPGRTHADNLYRSDGPLVAHAVALNSLDPAHNGTSQGAIETSMQQWERDIASLSAKAGVPPPQLPAAVVGRGPAAPQPKAPSVPNVPPTQQPPLTPGATLGPRPSKATGIQEVDDYLARGGIQWAGRPKPSDPGWAEWDAADLAVSGRMSLLDPADQAFLASVPVGDSDVDMARRAAMVEALERSPGDRDLAYASGMYAAEAVAAMQTPELEATTGSGTLPALVAEAQKRGAWTTPPEALNVFDVLAHTYGLAYRRSQNDWRVGEAAAVAELDQRNRDGLMTPQLHADLLQSHLGFVRSWAINNPQPQPVLAIFQPPTPSTSFGTPAPSTPPAAVGVQPGGGQWGWVGSGKLNLNHAPDQTGITALDSYLAVGGASIGPKPLASGAAGQARAAAINDLTAATNLLTSPDTTYVNALAPGGAAMYGHNDASLAMVGAATWYLSAHPGDYDGADIFAHDAAIRVARMQTDELDANLRSGGYDREADDAKAMRDNGLEIEAHAYLASLADGAIGKQAGLEALAFLDWQNKSGLVANSPWDWAAGYAPSATVSAPPWLINEMSKRSHTGFMPPNSAPGMPPLINLLPPAPPPSAISLTPSWGGPARPLDMSSLPSVTGIQALDNYVAEGGAQWGLPILSSDPGGAERSLAANAINTAVSTLSQSDQNLVNSMPGGLSDVTMVMRAAAAAHLSNFPGDDDGATFAAWQAGSDMADVQFPAGRDLLTATEQRNADWLHSNVSPIVAHRYMREVFAGNKAADGALDTLDWENTNGYITKTNWNLASGPSNPVTRMSSQLAVGTTYAPVGWQPKMSSNGLGGGNGTAPLFTLGGPPPPPSAGTPSWGGPARPVDLSQAPPPTGIDALDDYLSEGGAQWGAPVNYGDPGFAEMDAAAKATTAAELTLSQADQNVVSSLPGGLGDVTMAMRGAAIAHLSNFPGDTDGAIQAAATAGGEMAATQGPATEALLNPTDANGADWLSRYVSGLAAHAYGRSIASGGTPGQAALMASTALEWENDHGYVLQSMWRDATGPKNPIPAMAANLQSATHKGWNPTQSSNNTQLGPPPVFTLTPPTNWAAAPPVVLPPPTSAWKGVAGTTIDRAALPPPSGLHNVDNYLQGGGAQTGSTGTGSPIQPGEEGADELGAALYELDQREQALQPGDQAVVDWPDWSDPGIAAQAAMVAHLESAPGDHTGAYLAGWDAAQAMAEAQLPEMLSRLGGGPRLLADIDPLVAHAYASTMLGLGSAPTPSAAAGQVARWENDHRVMPKATAKALEDALGVSPFLVGATKGNGHNGWDPLNPNPVVPTTTPAGSPPNHGWTPPTAQAPAAPAAPAIPPAQQILMPHSGGSVVSPVALNAAANTAVPNPAPLATFPKKKPRGYVSSGIGVADAYLANGGQQFSAYDPNDPTQQPTTDAITAVDAAAKLLDPADQATVDAYPQYDTDLAIAARAAMVAHFAQNPGDVMGAYDAANKASKEVAKAQISEMGERMQALGIDVSPTSEFGQVKAQGGLVPSHTYALEAIRTFDQTTGGPDIDAVREATANTVDWYVARLQTQHQRALDLAAIHPTLGGEAATLPPPQLPVWQPPPASTVQATIAEPPLPPGVVGWTPPAPAAPKAPRAPSTTPKAPPKPKPPKVPAVLATVQGQTQRSDFSGAIGAVSRYSAQQWDTFVEEHFGNATTPSEIDAYNAAGQAYTDATGANKSDRQAKRLALTAMNKTRTYYADLERYNTGTYRLPVATDNGGLSGVPTIGPPIPVRSVGFPQVETLFARGGWDSTFSNTYGSVPPGWYEVSYANRDLPKATQAALGAMGKGLTSRGNHEQYLAFTAGAISAVNTGGTPDEVLTAAWDNVDTVAVARAADAKAAWDAQRIPWAPGIPDYDDILASPRGAYAVANLMRVGKAAQTQAGRDQAMLAEWQRLIDQQAQYQLTAPNAWAWEMLPGNNYLNAGSALPTPTWVGATTRSSTPKAAPASYSAPAAPDLTDVPDMADPTALPPAYQKRLALHRSKITDPITQASVHNAMVHSYQDSVKNGYSPAKAHSYAEAEGELAADRATHGVLVYWDGSLGGVQAMGTAPYQIPSAKKVVVVPGVTRTSQTMMVPAASKTIAPAHYIDDPISLLHDPVMADAITALSTRTMNSDGTMGRQGFIRAAQRDDNGVLSDQFMASVDLAQGFNALPDVVGQGELDAAIRSGEEEWYRANDDIPGRSSFGTDPGHPNDQYRKGPLYRGNTGGAAYGRGTYAASGKKMGSAAARREAANYASGRGAKVLRGTIKKGARTITQAQVAALHTKLLAAFDRDPGLKNNRELRQALTSDKYGLTAALYGYDAMIASNGDYLVIHNRGALRIQINDV